MSEWDYKYCEQDGLEFVIHYFEGEFYFDVDYKDDLFILDLGDEYEVEEPNKTLQDFLNGLGDN